MSDVWLMKTLPKSPMSDMLPRVKVSADLKAEYTGYYVPSPFRRLRDICRLCVGLLVDRRVK